MSNRHAGKKEPMPLSPRFWRKTTKAAIGGNPIRILVELITNSVDSYRRLEQQGLAKPPFEIIVKYRRVIQDVSLIAVKDEAEGMDADGIREALTYGAPTSGLGEGFGVRGAMGFGLKDSLMAMNGSRIMSIKDGRISEFEFIMEKGQPYRVPIRENEEITGEERAKLQISTNGTVVRGFVPKSFKTLTLNQAKEYLTAHFMMRRILQIPDYEILVGDSSSLSSFEQLIYKSPIGKKMTSKFFTISYPKLGNFPVSLSIKKASRELRPLHGEYRESGLIHYHDGYAVVDCTLWGFDNDPLASRLFGEVEIQNFSLLLKNEEDVVDEKRRGLNKKHSFVEKLVYEIDAQLRRIIDAERRHRQEEIMSLDPRRLRETLRELNKIAKEEGALGPVYEPPVLKTKNLAFYPSYIEVFEYLPKIVYLVVNPLIAYENRRIQINSDSAKIEVHPQNIDLTKEQIEKKRCFYKRITLIGKEKDIRGQVGAQLGDYVTTAGVHVVENPMLSPDEGFAFIPAETKIVDSQEKTVNLIINKDLLVPASNPPKAFSFSSSNPRITCPKKIDLPKKLDSYMLGKQMIRLRISIGGKQPGEKGKIVAQYAKNEAELSVEVVSPFETHGLFKEIRFEPGEGINAISYFDRDQGVILLYETHPLLEKYWTKKNTKRGNFLLFTADTVARLICWEILKEKERKGALEILNPENKLNEMQTYFDEIYFKRGGKLHDLLVKLIQTIKTK